MELSRSRRFHQLRHVMTLISKCLQIFLIFWYTALAKQLMLLPSLGITELLVHDLS